VVDDSPPEMARADLVEIAGADLPLVADRFIAVPLAGEFRLLQFGVGGHALVPVFARHFEHAVVEGMEASQRNELELVAHPTKLVLEAGDGGVVELLFPVERRVLFWGSESGA